MFFNSSNAAYYGKMGGAAKDSFKAKAKAWVEENGYDTLIEWIKNGSDRKACFAAQLMYGYAIGKPVEKLQIDDRKEVYINLSKDEALNAIAARFGIHPGRVLEARDSSVADGTTEIQAQGPTT